MNINSIVKMNNNKTVELAVLATTYPDMDILAIEASTLSIAGNGRIVTRKPAVLVMHDEYGNVLRTSDFTVKEGWESFSLTDHEFVEQLVDLMPWSSIGEINTAEVTRYGSEWKVSVVGTSSSDYLPLSSIYFTV